VKRALALAVALLLARPVFAEPTEAEKDAARILFTEGTELRSAGKLTAALERFQKAFDLAATPITTVELARTHQMLGHFVEARRLCLHVETLEKKPTESAKSLAAREEAKTLATELQAKIPTIVVRADGAATATLDGKPIQLGAKLAVDPGKHTVIAGKQSESFTIEAGEHDRVITIEVPKEAPAPLRPPPPPPPKDVTPAKTNTLVWIGGAVGGAGLLVGAGFGALALSSASTVKDECPSNTCPPSRHDDLDTTRRWATISTVGFAVAAVGATVFVIGLASPSGKKDAVTATVVPYATPSGGGLGLSASF